MSEIPIPKDAGDFSLIDQKVVYWMLQCKERDAFLRGLRAYVGFKQVPVDYNVQNVCLIPLRTIGLKILDGRKKLFFLSPVSLFIY